MLPRLLPMTLAVFGLGLIFACGSDGDSTSGTPTIDTAESRSPTPTTRPSQSPRSPALTSTIAATTVASATPSVEELLGNLEANRAKWDVAGSADYQFEFTMGCFCGIDDLPYTMVVRNAAPVSMTGASGIEVTPGSMTPAFEPYMTIPRMFEQAEIDIRTAHGVAVKYDTEYGYPIEISVATRGPTDTGSLVTITNFRTLE